MKNSNYTREFRDSSVQLVMNSNESTAKIAKDLDVNEKTLYNWVREYKKANNIPIVPRGGFSGNHSIKETAEEENKRLRAENKLLKQERGNLRVQTTLALPNLSRIYNKCNHYRWFKRVKQGF